jgi:hypothetical protein
VSKPIRESLVSNATKSSFELVEIDRVDTANTNFKEVPTKMTGAEFVGMPHRFEDPNTRNLQPLRRFGREAWNREPLARHASSILSPGVADLPGPAGRRPGQVFCYLGGRTQALLDSNEGVFARAAGQVERFFVYAEILELFSKPRSIEHRGRHSGAHSVGNRPKGAPVYGTRSVLFQRL